MPIYGSGDIHGQLDMLRAAHDLIAADRKVNGDDAAMVVHLGDFCDRGPDSAGVIQFLIDGLSTGEPWRVILGNHDRLFREFMNDMRVTDPSLRSDLTWLSPRMGGRETLESYGISDFDSRPMERIQSEALQKVPTAHRQFLAGLETSFETDDQIFVHAGIRPGVPMQDQVEDDLIWIRQEFLADTRDHGKLVVHGHTTIDDPTHYGNRVNLDSGAGYFRPLTTAVFEARDCWVLGTTGRKPLLPQI